MRFCTREYPIWPNLRASYFLCRYSITNKNSILVQETKHLRGIINYAGLSLYPEFLANVSVLKTGTRFTLNYLLVFRRKDLCEAKHDVECLKFCSKLTTTTRGGGCDKSLLSANFIVIVGQVQFTLLPMTMTGRRQRRQGEGVNRHRLPTLSSLLAKSDLPPCRRR